MTSKDYLNQIRKLDVLISIKKEELEVLYAKATVQSIKYGGDGFTNATRDVHKHERLCSAIIELEDKINDYIVDLLNKKQEVLDTIDKLVDHDEIQVLYLRYFKYLKWEEIAIKMNYSYMHIHRIHSKALEHVQELII